MQLNHLLYTEYSVSYSSYQVSTWYVQQKMNHKGNDLSFYPATKRLMYESTMAGSIYLVNNNQYNRKMKKIKIMIASGVMLSALAACNNESSEAEQNVTMLNSYVDSVENLTPVYTHEHWTTLDEGYQIRVVRADESMQTLKESDREKLEASKQRYAALKADYEMKIQEQEAVDYRLALRNRLFGEGHVGSDLNFEFATASNLLSIYQNFVNTVSDNRDSFSREDWDEIKVLYEALDTRKNTVEKDLPKGDNLEIAKLKIQFASIKATNRSGEKVDENSEAKQ